jgi:hypothetical protein
MFSSPSPEVIDKSRRAAANIYDGRCRLRAD